jgi:Fe-S oxidoreductase
MSMADTVAQRESMIAEGSPDASRVFLRHIAERPEGQKIRNCIQCGMCTGTCPHGYARAYGPRRMIAALRAGRLGDLYRSDSLWLCVSCYNCSFRCPSGIALTDRLIPSLREEMLVRGMGVPSELQAAFERSARYGNPFGESPKKRARWVSEAGVEVRVLGEGESADVLWFVECFPSYHRGNRPGTVALARILDALGVGFGILGRAEWCSGDTRRLGGEEGLFEMLCHHNAEEFAKRDFQEILVGDPHAYNALKNEYPRLGAAYRVRHYTQVLEDQEPKLSELMTRRVERTVTYHDPCYLGRRNGEYTAPRAVLQAIPGITLVEMPRNRENALCCGGGGGGVWLDGFIWERTRVPLPMQRVQEAARTGADTLAVACPLEVSRFEDAVKTAGLESKLSVMEISELVANAMGLMGGDGE